MGEHAAPKLDVGRIAFPSDEVPIGRVRIVEPDLVGSSRSEETVRIGDSELAAAIDIELELAWLAFRTTASVAQPRMATSREELVEVLNDVYVLYGLSTGVHQTEELVRGIERQAIAQAEAYRGRGT